MARVKHFIVLSATEDFKRGDRGSADVTYNEATGGYDVESNPPLARVTASVYNNEAGFRGRQWEVQGASIGDNQFPTLRAAAQAVLAVANDYTRTREMARQLGLVPA